jgi:hypothetical protein
MLAQRLECRRLCKNPHQMRPQALALTVSQARSQNHPTLKDILLSWCKPAIGRGN